MEKLPIANGTRTSADSDGYAESWWLPDAIDLDEDRDRFKTLLEKLKLKQPPNRTARSAAKALQVAEEIGYPLVVRPSYVLGGRAMEIVHEQKDLERYMREAVKVSNDSPVLLDRFLDVATEVDVDASGRTIDRRIRRFDTLFSMRQVQPGRWFITNELPQIG